MGKNGSENYLDNLLNSITTPDEDDFTMEMENSSDDFLREFESELVSEEYNSYMADFEKEMDSERGLSRKEAKVEESNDFDIEELSLDDVLEKMEAENSKVEEEPVQESTDDSENDDSFMVDTLEVPPISAEPDDDVDDISDLDEALLSAAQEAQDSIMVDTMGEENIIEEIGEPDLAGNSDSDLMDLLGEDAGLADIGNLLSEDGEEGTADGVDAFDEFAQKEMEEDSAAPSGGGGGAEKASEDSKEEKKKMSFFQKFKLILFGPDDDEDEDKGKDGASAAELSDENKKILSELDAEEGGKKGKKAKKEKKKKEPKPKKEKKPKPPKEPKPKKEKKPKKPKEKDNTPPLPKAPVIMIIIMAASLGAFVLIGTNLLGYQSKINLAKAYYNQAMAGVVTGEAEEINKYTIAYKQMVGVDVKEADMEMYNKLKILSAVSSQYDAYDVYKKSGYQAEALDNLICAAGRCEANLESAKEFGCEEQLNALYSNVENVLQSEYGMTMEEALSIYNLHSRDEYTLAIRKKILELGVK